MAANNNAAVSSHEDDFDALLLKISYDGVDDNCFEDIEFDLGRPIDHNNHDNISQCSDDKDRLHLTKLLLSDPKTNANYVDRMAVDDSARSTSSINNAPQPSSEYDHMNSLRLLNAISDGYKPSSDRISHTAPVSRKKPARASRDELNFGPAPGASHFNGHPNLDNHDINQRRRFGGLFVRQDISFGKNQPYINSHQTVRTKARRATFDSAMSPSLYLDRFYFHGGTISDANVDGGDVFHNPPTTSNDVYQRNHHDYQPKQHISHQGPSMSSLHNTVDSAMTPNLSELFNFGSNLNTTVIQQGVEQPPVDDGMKFCLVMQRLEQAMTRTNLSRRQLAMQRMILHRQNIPDGCRTSPTSATITESSPHSNIDHPSIMMEAFSTGSRRDGHKLKRRATLL